MRPLDPPRHWFHSFTEATATTLQTLAAGILPSNPPTPGADPHNADLRPQVSFDIQTSRAQGAVVLLDDQDVGRAGTYAEGVAALSVPPGSHRLKLDADGIIILDEQFDLGEGARQTFIAR